MKVLNKITRSVVCLIVICSICMNFNPVDVYATQRSSKNISINSTIDLDSKHNIDVKADVYVEYGWEEGYYGWIDKMELDLTGGVASDNVYIDEFSFDGEYYTGSKGYYSFYFFGFQRGAAYNDYTGYIYIYVSCDEWGDLSWWVEYEEI